MSHKLQILKFQCPTTLQSGNFQSPIIQPKHFRPLKHSKLENFRATPQVLSLFNLEGFPMIKFQNETSGVKDIFPKYLQLFSLHILSTSQQLLFKLSNGEIICNLRMCYTNFIQYQLCAGQCKISGLHQQTETNIFHKTQQPCKELMK